MIPNCGHKIFAVFVNDDGSLSRKTVVAWDEAGRAQVVRDDGTLEQAALGDGFRSVDDEEGREASRRATTPRAV